MKILHIGDLHLGKLVQQVSMIEDQAIVLDEILTIMKDQNIETLIIAGDVYDRSIPTTEAVNLFNVFLNNAINQHQFKVFIISGNHDSSERLDFASSILSRQGLYIEGQISKTMKKVTLNDEFGPINFYLLPFFKPSQIRSLFEEETITEFDQSMRYYLSKQTIDTSERNILITHQFVAGSQASITSDSENLLSVGGTSIIGLDAFSDFDYVALGHLHAPQNFNGGQVAYSGSLLKYSASEAKQKKSISLIEIKNKGNLISMPILLHPQKDLRILTGDFDTLCKEPIGNRNDYVFFEIDNLEYIPNAMEKLRILYPSILNISYPKRDNAVGEAINALASYENVTDVFSVFQDFYKVIMGEDINPEMLPILNSVIDQMKGEMK